MKTEKLRSTNPVTYYPGQSQTVPPLCFLTLYHHKALQSLLCSCASVFPSALHGLPALYQH